MLFIILCILLDQECGVIFITYLIFPFFSQEVEILEFDKENFTIRAVG